MAVTEEGTDESQNVTEYLFNNTDGYLTDQIEIGEFDGYCWTALHDHRGPDDQVASGATVKPWKYQAGGFSAVKLVTHHTDNNRMVLTMVKATYEASSWSKFDSGVGASSKETKKEDPYPVKASENRVVLIGEWTQTIHDDAPMPSVWQSAKDEEPQSSPVSLNGQPVPISMATPEPSSSSWNNPQHIPVGNSPFTPHAHNAGDAKSRAIANMQGMTPQGSNALMMSPGGLVPMQPTPIVGQHPQMGMVSHFGQSAFGQHGFGFNPLMNPMMNQRLSIPQGIVPTMHQQLAPAYSPMSIAATNPRVSHVNSSTSPMPASVPAQNNDVYMASSSPYDTARQPSSNYQQPMQTEQSQGSKSKSKGGKAFPGKGGKDGKGPKGWNHPSDAWNWKHRKGANGEEGLSKEELKASWQQYSEKHKKGKSHGGGDGGDGDDGDDDQGDGGNGYGGSWGSNGKGGQGKGGFDPLWSHLTPTAIKKRFEDDGPAAAAAYGAGLASSFVNRNQQQSFQGAGQCPKWPQWNAAASSAEKVIAFDAYLDALTSWGARVIGNGGLDVMQHVITKGEEYFWMKKLGQQVLSHTLPPEPAVHGTRLDVASYDTIIRITEEVFKGGCQLTVGEALTWHRTWNPPRTMLLHPWSKLVAYMTHLHDKYKVSNTKDIADEISTPNIDKNAPRKSLSEWILAWEQCLSLDSPRAQLLLREATLKIKDQLYVIYDGDRAVTHTITTQAANFCLSNELVSWQSCIQFLKVIMSHLSDTVCMPISRNGPSTTSAHAASNATRTRTTKPSKDNPSSFRCIPHIFNKCVDPCPLFFSHDRNAEYAPRAPALIPRYGERNNLPVPGYAKRKIAQMTSTSAFLNDIMEEGHDQDQHQDDQRATADWQAFMTEVDHEEGQHPQLQQVPLIETPMATPLTPASAEQQVVTAKVCHIDMYGGLGVTEQYKALTPEQRRELPCVWWEGAGFCPRILSCGRCEFMHKRATRGKYANEKCNPSTCKARGSCPRNHGEDERIVPAPESALLAGVMQSQADMLREAAINATVDANMICELFPDKCVVSFKNACDIPRSDLFGAADAMLDSGANGPVVHVKDRRFIKMSERKTYMHTSDNQVTTVPVGLVAVPFIVRDPGSSTHSRNDPPGKERWMRVSAVVMETKEYSAPICPELWFQVLCARTSYGYNQRTPLQGENSSPLDIHYERNLPFIRNTEVVSVCSSVFDSPEDQPWHPHFRPPTQDALLDNGLAVAQKLYAEPGESRRV